MKIDMKDEIQTVRMIKISLEFNDDERHDYKKQASAIAQLLFYHLSSGVGEEFFSALGIEKSSIRDKLGKLAGEYKSK